MTKLNQGNIPHPPVTTRTPAEKTFTRHVAPPTASDKPLRVDVGHPHRQAKDQGKGFVGTAKVVKVAK
jgi:hypothetical protein